MFQLDKLLPKLGAHRVAPLGLGDDDDCIEEDLEKWSASLWPALDAKLGGSGKGNAAVAVASPAYEANTYPATTKVPPPALPHGAIAVRVAEVRELHSSASDRSCVHVELDISGSGIEYSPGDHVAIHPENPREAVELAAMLLGEPLDAVVELKMPEGQAADMLSHPPPTPATLQTLLASYADLLGPVTRASLLALASCASDPKEEARLRHLASPEGKNDFSSWVAGARRRSEHWWDVLLIPWTTECVFRLGDASQHLSLAFVVPSAFLA